MRKTRERVAVLVYHTYPQVTFGTMPPNDLGDADMRDIPVREPVDPLAEETRRLRRLRIAVDLTAAVIAQQPRLSVTEARQLIENARIVATRLFPGKGDTFDLIIRPRLARIAAERALEV